MQKKRNAAHSLNYEKNTDDLYDKILSCVSLDNLG